jgi:ssDNA-binding Zn-finger/Zn-ribbon topoisomerase 1
MARQPKVEHTCPKCGGPLKRTIGARTRKKYWECVLKGFICYRMEISHD